MIIGSIDENKGTYIGGIYTVLDKSNGQWGKVGGVGGKGIL
jgi:hypothetical protein